MDKTSISIDELLGLAKYQNDGRYKLGQYVFDKEDELALYEFLNKISAVTYRNIDLMMHFFPLGHVEAKFDRMGILNNRIIRFLNPNSNTPNNQAIINLPLEHFHHAQIMVIGNSYVKLMIIGAIENAIENDLGKLYEIHIDFNSVEFSTQK